MPQGQFYDSRPERSLGNTCRQLRTFFGQVIVLALVHACPQQHCGILTAIFSCRLHPCRVGATFTIWERHCIASSCGTARSLTTRCTLSACARGASCPSASCHLQWTVPALRPARKRTTTTQCHGMSGCAWTAQSQVSLLLRCFIQQKVTARDRTHCTGPRNELT